MLTVPLLDTSGQKLDMQELDPQLFDRPLRSDILHQVVLYQLAKRRAGSACTKSRGEVAGSNRKPFRQKGTGRARLGSFRAPHCRGGGVAFGSKPRDHGYKLNKKVLKQGLGIAVSDCVRSAQLVFVKNLSEVRKTREMAGLIKKINPQERSLVVGRDLLAVKNLEKANFLPVEGLNVRDILRHQFLIVDHAELQGLIQRLQDKQV